MVHTAGGSTGLTVKGADGLETPLDTTTPQLLLQVVIAGQLTTLPIAYDPVTKQVAGDAEATRLLRHSYRAGFEHPWAT